MTAKKRDDDSRAFVDQPSWLREVASWGIITPEVMVMAQERTILEQAIEMAGRLGPAERWQLRQALDQMNSGPTEEDPEITFKRLLFERGLISEIRLAPKTDDPLINRRPVPVEGKPVSETIIEDRG
jgi:hypothetical protein